MKKTIIGIIGAPVYDDEGDSVIALYDGYKNAVVKENCIPFMISPLGNIDYYKTKLSDIPAITKNEEETYKEMVDMCSGIIIPGGYRIYDFYKYIVKYAIKKDIPVLGICMGMQLLAGIDDNVDYIEKNETVINHKQKEKNYIHNVEILKDTLLYDILKTNKIKVNSRHNYHVSKLNSFKVSALSEDGLIEGIELPNKNFVIGIQWHPEKMIDYDVFANKIFERFIFKCNELKGKNNG